MRTTSSGRASVIIREIYDIFLGNVFVFAFNDCHNNRLIRDISYFVLVSLMISSQIFRLIIVG